VVPLVHTRAEIIPTVSFASNVEGLANVPRAANILSELPAAAFWYDMLVIVACPPLRVVLKSLTSSFKRSTPDTAQPS
jgi:hypothetical protein